MRNEILKSITYQKPNFTTINEATKWFRGLANKLKRIKPLDIIRDKDSEIVKRPRMGDMIMFLYQAKTKDKLPYWDRFPLVILIDKYPDGYLGLNLHYLPPRQRAILLKRLMDLTNNNKLNNTTRMARATYGLLKGATKFKLFKPCVKRYLNSNMGRMIRVNPEDWQSAIYLPVERFQKKGKQTVWKDSMAGVK